jgi:hypothetical protein
MMRMFDQITKAIMNFFLHLAIKNSDVEDLSLDIKEMNGAYILGINSKIVVGTNGKTVRKNEAVSKNLAKAFVIAMGAMVLFVILGMSIPDASLGRSFILISAFPAFVVNVIGARYIIKSVK